jgi:hypothetical protein
MPSKTPSIWRIEFSGKPNLFGEVSFLKKPLPSIG